MEPKWELEAWRLTRGCHPLPGARVGRQDTGISSALQACTVGSCDCNSCPETRVTWGPAVLRLLLFYFDPQSAALPHSVRTANGVHAWAVL